ncbi:MAG: DNA polymerase III subunit beta, partial [Planctomycetota bacterium]
MKYQCDQKGLLDAFSLAAGVVAGKGTRPGPQEILLEVLPDGTQKVSATDLEVSLHVTWKSEKIEVMEPGSVTVPAAKTLSILREIPSEAIEIETEDAFVVLSSRKSRFKVVANPVEEFPPLPEPTLKNKVSLDAALFLRMVRCTAFATATERVHYSLNGVYFLIEKGEVRMVGTDGRRLAVFGKKSKGLKEAGLKGIVPNKGIRLFEKLAAGREGDVTLSLEKNQIFLVVDGMEASTLLIEGTYPDYNRVLPKENDQVLEVASADMLAGLRQSAILAGEEAKAVRFRLGKDSLTLFSETVGAGEAKVEIPVVYGGEAMELQFNPLFFMDFLRQVDEERVTFKFKDPETAALAQIGQEYTYVVMPL